MTGRTQDFFDWQRQVFDVSRESYSGQIQDLISGSNALPSDVYSAIAVQQFEWFGVILGGGNNLVNGTADNTWKTLNIPPAPDAHLVYYPVAWRDKAAQLNGGTLTDPQFGIRVPWRGLYRLQCITGNPLTPALGGAMTFATAGFSLSTFGFQARNRLYSSAWNLVSNSATWVIELTAGTLVRPAWLANSVGQNGIFRFNSLYLEVLCLRQLGP